jgi:hypothetical protein
LRLAEEGEPFPPLDTEEPVAEGEAMERVRASWTAHRIARPSPQLLRLIRAGKLTHVGFAFPVSCATARDKKEKEGALRVADGGITVSDGEKASKFGEFDARSLEAARAEAAPCAIAGSYEQPDTGSRSVVYGSQPAKTGHTRLFDRECCRVWNTGGRCNGACGRRQSAARQSMQG